MPAYSSAAGLLALLEEEDDALRLHALKQLNEVHSNRRYILSFPPVLLLQGRECPGQTRMTVAAAGAGSSPREPKEAGKLSIICMDVVLDRLICMLRALGRGRGPEAGHPRRNTSRAVPGNPREPDSSDLELGGAGVQQWSEIGVILWVRADATAPGLQVVHDHWFQISSSISAVEGLFEDDDFSHRQLAALLASKVTPRPHKPSYPLLEAPVTSPERALAAF